MAVFCGELKRQECQCVAILSFSCIIMSSVCRVVESWERGEWRRVVKEKKKSKRAVQKAFLSD